MSIADSNKEKVTLDKEALLSIFPLFGYEGRLVCAELQR